MLHLRCGTDILKALDVAGVPGRKASWADPLCEGPWPALTRELVRPMRARYLAERGQLGFMATLADLTEADEALASAAGEDEVVLWFEHDLYDQPILAWLLVQLEPMAGAARVSLVQVHEHPSVPRFVGLGQLGPEALAGLFARRATVEAPTFALARRAVAAWTAETPEALEGLRAPQPAMPHLGAAVTRYLAEYPERHSGLSRSERLALTAIAAGAGTAREAFGHVQAAELAPWMGDLMLFARLRLLAEGITPLLVADGEWTPLSGEPADPRLALTDAGRRVLEGEADWLALQPQERWMGGVHLRPGGPDWRWSEAEQRTVRR